MLKIATRDDLTTIRRMAYEFMESTEMKHYAYEEDLNAVIDSLLDRDGSIVLLHGEDGMIAGTISKFPFGPYIVATEMAWWVNPDKRKSNIGRDLLEAFEFWAKKVGADMVHMVSLDDSVGKFYEKKGYKLLERAYIKAI